MFQSTDYQLSIHERGLQLILAQLELAVGPEYGRNVTTSTPLCVNGEGVHWSGSQRGLRQRLGRASLAPGRAGPESEDAEQPTRHCQDARSVSPIRLRDSF